MSRWSTGRAAVVQEPGPREASFPPALDSIHPDTRLKSLPSDWHLPENDIDKCLSFSRVRCVMSLMSLCLLMTDIPRTGLGIEDVYQLFPVKAGPSVAMHFVPWAYLVAHIWQHAPISNSNNAIKTTNLWSYQYDSTSIGLRGIAELLNLSGLYPDTLPLASATSHGAPTAATLSLNTTFYELDALASAVRSYLSRETQSKQAGFTASAPEPQPSSSLPPTGSSCIQQCKDVLGVRVLRFGGHRPLGREG